MITKLNDSLKKEQKEITDKVYKSIITEFDNGDFHYDSNYYDKKIVFPALKIYINNIKRGQSISVFKIYMKLSKHTDYFTYQISSNGDRKNASQLPMYFSAWQKFQLARRISRYFKDVENNDDVHKNQSRLETLKEFLKSNKKINRESNLNEILGD